MTEEQASEFYKRSSVNSDSFRVVTLKFSSGWVFSDLSTHSGSSFDRAPSTEAGASFEFSRSDHY